MNFKELLLSTIDNEINETDSGDMDYTPTSSTSNMHKRSKTNFSKLEKCEDNKDDNCNNNKKTNENKGEFKNILLKKLNEDISNSLDPENLEFLKNLNKDELDSAIDNAIDNFDNLSGEEQREIFNISREELIDILENDCDIDEKHLILDILNQSDIEGVGVFDNFDNLIKGIRSVLDAKSVIEIAFIILGTLQEIDDYYEDYEQYGSDPIDEAFYLIENIGLEELGLNETVIDISHTKQLRRNRRKSVWKRQAVLRARYRKTGQGKRERKKALRYLKKYRRQHKSKLKRYAIAYQRRWKGDKK